MFSLSGGGTLAFKFNFIFQNTDEASFIQIAMVWNAWKISGLIPGSSLTTGSEKKYFKHVSQSFPINCTCGLSKPTGLFTARCTLSLLVYAVEFDRRKSHEV